jgi:stearoyl-CoA desaturase (Delta-9 desaturase)
VVIIILFLICHWYLSLFSQTFFQHRYAAHRAFTMNSFWEKFFFVFAYLTQGSSYMSPRAYAIMHRMHHAYTDTPQDPHSPAHDKNIFAMMWRTRIIYRDILKGRHPVEIRFTKNLPVWKWFDSMGNFWLSRFLWTVFYAYLYIIFAPSLWFLLILPLHIAMGPIHGVVINWFAHKYGHINYLASNTSRNLFKIDWLMMGEGYHNNHHVFPSKSNFASVKGEFDLCYPVIFFLEKLRIIRLRIE